MDVVPGARSSAAAKAATDWAALRDRLRTTTPSAVGRAWLDAIDDPEDDPATPPASPEAGDMPDGR